jgi:hypothetical protein
MGVGETQQKLERHRRLLEVGHIITSEMNFAILFPLVIQHTNSIMDTRQAPYSSLTRRRRNSGPWSRPTSREP